jgi:hypothetical protein
MTTDLTQRRFLRASSRHLQQQWIFYRKGRKKAIELCKRPPQRCGFFFNVSFKSLDFTRVGNC